MQAISSDLRAAEMRVSDLVAELAQRADHMGRAQVGPAQIRVPSRLDASQHVCCAHSMGWPRSVFPAAWMRLNVCAQHTWLLPAGAAVVWARHARIWSTLRAGGGQ